MPRAFSIVAPGNGSGKTRLAATILEAVPGAFTAVKFTTVYRDGENCPRTETACACRELHGRFTVLDDPAIVARPGTDTGRLAAAGALRTLWCLAVPGGQAALWEHLASSILRPGEAILTEGNRIVRSLRPERLVLVASAALPRDRWKEDTWELAERADLVLVNSPAGSSPESSAALAGELSARLARPTPIVDVSRPLPQWPDRTLDRIVRAFLDAGRAVPSAPPRA